MKREADLAGNKTMREISQASSKSELSTAIYYLGGQARETTRGSEANLRE